MKIDVPQSSARSLFSGIWEMPGTKFKGLNLAPDYKAYSNAMFGKVIIQDHRVESEWGWRSLYGAMWSTRGSTWANSRWVAWFVPERGFLLARKSNEYVSTLEVVAVNLAKAMPENLNVKADDRSVADAFQTLSAMEFDPKTGTVTRQPSPEAYRTALRVLASLRAE